MEQNELGLPIGFAVPEWKSVCLPSNEPIQGDYCRLEPLDPIVHAEDLFAANKHDTEDKLWTYLRYGPFRDLNEYSQWLEAVSDKTDPQFYAIVDLEKNKAVGLASYLRIRPEYGSIEVGHLCYSPLLQGTVAATEAMFLMMRRAFEMGYRRYEWKCNSLNIASCNAARRLGFSPEGVFRQDAVVKGRNRDTAWFSIIDTEWGMLKEAFEKWLSPSNFDEKGKQVKRLSDLTRIATESF